MAAGFAIGIEDSPEIVFPTVSLRREFVFVDEGVSDADVLLSEMSAIRPGIERTVIRIHSDENGLAQIAEALKGHVDIDAIHILSHGDQAQLNLGSSSITRESLSEHSDDFQAIRNSLADDADLLIYGCNFGGGEAGARALRQLARMTGADVAASDDLTGHASLGGDWDLEIAIGRIETDAIVDSQSAEQFVSTLALSDATLGIVSDGTPIFDADNNPGNDMDGSNGIIRTHDTIIMEIFYNTDAGGATDLNFTSTLPDGLVFDALPAAAALDPRSMIVDSVTGLPGGDSRGIIAYLPDVSGTFTSSLVLEARALGGAQGTPLNGVTFEVNASENATTLTTESFDFTLSSAAHMDIQLLSPVFRGVFPNAAGDKDGVVYTYSIGILGDHPTRTGSDGVKGSAPIEDDFTFDLDFTDVSSGATIFDWGASLGTTSDQASDGITRNYERIVNISGNAETVWSHGSRPSGRTDEINSTAWSEERSTPDSGDWNIIGSAGPVYTAQVSGSDTTGSHFPERGGSGGVLPVGDKWFASGQVSVWIPLCDILPGEDGIEGNLDDGLLEITPRITNFDPDDAFGITNNFGDSGTEDTSNNDYTHTILAFNMGGGTKRNASAGHPTSGVWIETGSAWNSGDAETSVGHLYDSRVNGGRNQGVLPLPGLIFGDKIDNTATKIAANSYPAGSGDGWSRVYASGGPNTGTHLTYGTDYIIEFGTGGVGGAAGGWTDWDSMGDATLADGESPVWSQDPTDPALGGTAYADGVRDSITKWRIVMQRDIEPGESLIALITHETVGHSSLDPSDPDGNIIANFMATSIEYQREDTNLDNDWRTSEYSPLDHNVFPGASASQLLTGDRVWIVDANVDVDKSVVDLGAGNSYLAGSAATIQLEGSVTIPGPDSGAPAEDVYITDVLPPGLTVVGGSASPSVGTTFTAGDGSTVSVQAVEYFDGTAWNPTWTFGATGIRWFYGDVPLNTSLPSMNFDVLIPYDAMNGETWDNTAVASSPSDDSPEELRSSSAGLVAVQIAAMAAGKQVVTPLVPEDTRITYELGVANVSDDKDVPWFDLVDLFPYDGDFEGSDFNGGYTNIEVTGLGADYALYVTSQSPVVLDAADGTVDGYADPGTSSDGWFQLEGTGDWQYTLADVIAGVPGAPTMSQLTALRVVSDKSVNPILGPGESVNFQLHLDPSGNVGIPSDHYTNKFAARTDPGSLPLPVNSAPVTAVVVAPDVEIHKETCLDETGVNCDPTNDAHWGETATFDDSNEATFRIRLVNTGTAEITATVNDAIPAGLTYVANSAVPSIGDVSGFPPTWVVTIGPGGEAHMTFSATSATPESYTNTASVDAADQFGQMADDSDVSAVSFESDVSVAKYQTGVVVSPTNPNHFEVSYEVQIANTSVFDLANLTLSEDLFDAFGAGFAGVATAPTISESSISSGGSEPTINGFFDGNLSGTGDDQILAADGLLKPNDSVTLIYTVIVDVTQLADTGTVFNQVEAGGLSGGPGGAPVSDLSDDGDAPDSDNPTFPGDDGAGGVNDPTPLRIPLIELTKEIAGTPTPALSGIEGNFDVTYEFMVTNTGTSDLENISVEEDFVDSLGDAFVGIVNGPTVTMTTATDNPDFNTTFDGGTADADVFINAPTQTVFQFGGSTTSTTVDRNLILGDDRYVVDPNQTYTLMADAFAGDGAGGAYDPASTNFLGFASYDVDGNFVSVNNYAKFTAAVDTTLAAPLNPGDTTITLTDGTGWANSGRNNQRALAWYGYTDSTGFTYPDYGYTRNVLINAWPAGGVSGNTITLTNPWSGPALAAGDAVRNSTSGGSYQYVLLSNQHIDETGDTYTAEIGGGFITNGATGQTLWRPGTHTIAPLILADWGGGGTNTQLNVSNFKIDAANTNLLEPNQKVTFQITVEIDPDAPGAIYDGVTGDGNGDLENQASVSGTDPVDGAFVDDLSDDPTDPSDSNPDGDENPDDPTALILSDIGISKQVVGVPSQLANGNWSVEYQLVVENTGAGNLNNLQVIEDLESEFGSDVYVSLITPAAITAGTSLPGSVDPVLDASWDGNLNASGNANILNGNSGTLVPTDTFTIRFTVEVNPDASGTSSPLDNQAEARGTDGNGDLVMDDSDSGSDPNSINSGDAGDTGGSDDPTPLLLPEISLAKQVNGPYVDNNDGTWTIPYQLVLEN